MELFSKEFWGLISLIIGIGVQIPYTYAIWKKRITPHAITFFIWSLTMGGVAYAQIIDGAGSGAWVTVAGFFCMFLILLLSLFWHGEKQVVPFDWYCLALAIMGFILWIVTSSVIWGILLLTMADIIAYGPTFRKTWLKPLEENPWFWLIGTTCFFFSILATDLYNFNTLFYPVMATIFNIGLALMIWYRRFQLKT